MLSLRDNPLFRLELDLYGRGRRRWAMRAGTIAILVFILPPVIGVLESILGRPSFIVIQFLHHSSWFMLLIVLLAALLLTRRVHQLTDHEQLQELAQTPLTASEYSMGFLAAHYVRGVVLLIAAIVFWAINRVQSLGPFASMYIRPYEIIVLMPYFAMLAAALPLSLYLSMRQIRVRNAALYILGFLVLLQTLLQGTGAQLEDVVLNATGYNFTAAAVVRASAMIGVSLGLGILFYMKAAAMFVGHFWDRVESGSAQIERLPRMDRWSKHPMFARIWNWRDMFRGAQLATWYWLIVGLTASLFSFPVFYVLFSPFIALTWLCLVALIYFWAACFLIVRLQTVWAAARRHAEPRGSLSNNSGDKSQAVSPLLVFKMMYYPFFYINLAMALLLGGALLLALMFVVKLSYIETYELTASMICSLFLLTMLMQLAGFGSIISSDLSGDGEPVMKRAGTIIVTSVVVYVGFALFLVMLFFNMELRIDSVLGVLLGLSLAFAFPLAAWMNMRVERLLRHYRFFIRIDDKSEEL